MGCIHVSVHSKVQGCQDECLEHYKSLLTVSNHCGSASVYGTWVVLHQFMGLDMSGFALCFVCLTFWTGSFSFSHHTLTVSPNQSNSSRLSASPCIAWLWLVVLWVDLALCFCLSTSLLPPHPPPPIPHPPHPHPPTLVPQYNLYNLC